ncbi:hypothetical protein QOZ80_6AG0509290 [Eleusine coracana subsp. coracana]|nr:hypothetical protein QOZ80_6AG0509290 [Eleusine coracana subsp. coracana]
MALQAPADGNGYAVMGTACMVPLQFQPPPPPAATGGGGGGMGLGSPFDLAMNLIRDSSQFLLANQRYIWIANYNMRDLGTSTKRLHDVLVHVQTTITDAQSLGWRPSPLAQGWVREGKELMEDAAKLVVSFKDLNASSIAISNFPCFAASRCRLNCDAVMQLNRVKEHIELAKKEGYLLRDFDAVATEPRKMTDDGSPHLAHGDSLPGTLPPAADECILPSVFVDEPTTPHKSAGMMTKSPSYQQGRAYIDAKVPAATTICDDKKVQLNTFTQVHAVLGSDSCDKFPVLVRVKAPMYTHQMRAPIDLVMVLDISATMRSGLQNLKQGAQFAILNLRRDDRLSIVTFGPKADYSELTLMTDEEKQAAIAAVASLEARGGVGITAALKRAYEVLQKRTEAHRVGAILLLTDGKDNKILKEIQANVQRRSLEEADKDAVLRRKYPTYTFGFGTEHDPRTLYYLAREGYGTYSFADADSRNIEVAMALCIGGLTSIVAQDVKVTLEAAHPEVKISEIRRGFHEGGLSSDKLGWIRIKDLFGDEEKNFIVYVSIPREEGHSSSTKILNVKAEYFSPVTKKKINVENTTVSVERPKKILSQNGQMSNCYSEVAVEICRVDALDGVWGVWDKIAHASNLTPYFNKEGVKRWDIPDIDRNMVLNELEKLLRIVDPTVEKSADPEMQAVQRKLFNDLTKMKDALPRGIVTALPYMLSWLSAHKWQRAATQVTASESSFLTPRMHNMIGSVETALTSRLTLP